MDINTIPSEVLSLVNILKTKIVMALAVVMVKRAKTEGITAVQYAKQFQEKYIREYQDELDPVLEQRFLSHCQDEVLDKLRKCLPEPVDQSQHTRNIDDCFLYGGSSLDWFDDWCLDAQKPKKNFQKIFSLENNALKNIEFVESVMRMSSESEKNTPVPASLLHQIFYDEAEYTSQPCYRESSAPPNNKQFSEDSGIGNSEKFSESCGVNSVSGNVVKFVLQSSNADQLLLHSVKFLVNYVKSEVRSKPKDSFNNWKGSLVEYACDTVRDCSCRNIGCREKLLNLIFELLDDIWIDERVSQHVQWEVKVCIVNELLTCSEVCYQILQYISDKVDLFLKCLVKKSDDVPLILEKLSLFLNTYCNVCVALKNLKSQCEGEGEQSVNTEETDVTRLWQEKWCTKDAKEDVEEVDKITDTQIQVLERLIIHVSSRYSLVALLAIEALKGFRELITSNKPSQSNSE